MALREGQLLFDVAAYAVKCYDVDDKLFVSDDAKCKVQTA